MRHELRGTMVLLATGLALVGCGGNSPTQKLVILHTNDIHSYLMGASPEADYTPATVSDDATSGGMARLASAVTSARKSAKASGTPVLLLDAGDFMMGTLFETISTKAAAELTMMNALGYDATTIGNHELDWGPDGLAAILQTAVANGTTVPIVASNMVFDPNDPGDDNLQALATAGVITTKIVKTVGSLKVGIFGILGKNASLVAALKAPLSFTDIKDASSQMVAELRQVDKVDLVIALSHSGISSDGTGEDADLANDALANDVPGIDVIVSGHSHDTLAAPFRVGRTLIVTAGCYTKYLGDLQLTVTKGANPGDPASVTMDDYELLPIDDQIPGDTQTQTTVESYIAGVDQGLAGSGLSYRSVVGETNVDLPFPPSVESPVGDLVTDAYRTVSTALQPEDPPVIAVEGNGQIRSNIAKGKGNGQIWFADLFRVLPDGVGPDGNPGYPLVTFYLNAKDLASGFEFDAAQDVVPPELFLQVSGLSVSYDMTKAPFARVTGVALTTAGGSQPLDLTNTSTCYKVVTTNYVAGFLGFVSDQTGGLLSVTAKDSDCVTPVDATTRFVDADPNTAGVQELKGWQALLQYVSGFPDTNGDSIPDVPAAYVTTQGRIVAQ
jgi:5'-nucleotidase / UDP-sugar diphosphatase